MPRFFTLRQAEMVLPEVERHLRRSISLKTDFSQAETDLQQWTHRVMLAGGTLVRPEEALALKTRRENLVAELKKAIETIQEFGCLIKDLDIGLLDFPTRFRGQEVYLCWKLGEDGIEYWHGVQEGFAGRKPIDQEFLDHHEGDAPQ